jgi:PmbA protein
MIDHVAAGQDQLRAITDAVLAASRAAETEVIVIDTDSSLTRFANGEIHQNVAERDIEVRVRVVDDHRTGVASTNQVNGDALNAAAARALEAARGQPASDETTPLAPPAEVAPLDVDPATAAATPEDRAERVGLICAAADARGVRAFGAFSTGVTTTAVANSHGLYVSSPRAAAELQVATIVDDGHGWADRAGTRIDEIDAAGAAEEAIDKALRTRNAIAIEPGVYPVVLEEYAVEELLEMLNDIGFSGLAVGEGRTFMRPGERITGENIDIWDDGHDPAGLPAPFDYEGIPKQRVDLISKGVASGLLHDLASASRAGVESTGHGLPAPNPMGAWASNLAMAGGEAESKAALAEGIERGVWVTRTWYVNILHPTQSLVTGMTRDGTFLIENGEVTRPIKNMRFTQSVMEAFGTASALTRQRKLQLGPDYQPMASLVPAMRLERFNFTSRTR